MITTAPDPAPNTGHRPITYAPYTYVVPGENRRHEIVPGLSFVCRVSVDGRRSCRAVLRFYVVPSGPTA